MAYAVPENVTHVRIQEVNLRNQSSVDVSSRLWSSLAERFDLHGRLPEASRDEFGFYRRHKTLTVRVSRRRAVPDGEVTTSGTYSYGRIHLYPCNHCTPGFLTKVFIHELVHAWLHQYRETEYVSWISCTVAERLAKSAFTALGGVRTGDVCGSHRLPNNVALQHLDDFELIATSLRNTPDEATSSRLRLARPILVSSSGVCGVVFAIRFSQGTR